MSTYKHHNKGAKPEDSNNENVSLSDQHLEEVGRLGKTFWR